MSSLEGTTPSKNTGSSFKVLLLGATGILVVGGLDFVAPDHDICEKTYWSFQNESKMSTAVPSKEEEPPKRLPLTVSDTPHQCQIVIVGAGFAGLHTALALTERHPSYQLTKGLFHKHRKRHTDANSSNTIMILDAGRVGEGASGKAKGLVVPGIQVPEVDLAAACGSKDIAQKVYELSYEALHRLKHDIVHKYKIDCDWIDAGVVEASIHEADGDEEEEEEKEEDGCVALSASEVRSVLGQPQSSTLYKSGEFDPSCSGVDPLALTCGLAQILEGQGVRIFEKSRVTKIEKLSETKSTIKPSIQAAEAYQYIVTTEGGAQIHCQHGELPF